MPAINSYAVSNIRSLLNRLRADLRQPETVEQASQACASLLVQEFPESLVLVRLYATLPFGQLPPDVRRFATHIAQAQGTAASIGETVPVLALLGTRGTRPEWNDRRMSVGHVGIPLLSAEFIGAIPMVARLLREMGTDLDGVDQVPGGVFERIIASGMSGVFFVADARTTVDDQGRLVIPARQFVADHQIKTVFGLGGTYTGGVFVTLIAFSREAIDRAQVVRFTPLIHVFKAATVSLVLNNRIFKE